MRYPVNAVKTVTDLNGGYVVAGDTLEYQIPMVNTGDDSADLVMVSDTLPLGVTYVPGSIVVTSGANAGAKTDASGDDQAEYVAVNRRVVVRVGAGATSAAGGSLAPAGSSGVRFRVTIDGATANGTQIDNAGSISYRAHLLGTDETLASSTASTRLNLPDLTAAATHSGSFVRGASATWQGS